MPTKLNALFSRGRWGEREREEGRGAEGGMDRVTVGERGGENKRGENWDKEL